MRRVLGLLLIGLATGAVAAPGDRARILANVDHLRASGKLHRALVVAEQGRRSFPDSLSLHARYQDIRLSLGQEAQVRAEYRRAWQRQKTVDAICLYARLLKGKRAITEYKLALRKDPHHFWANYGLGVALLRAGRLAEAGDCLERAQSLAPKEPAPPIRLGQLHERAGRLDRALECYERAAFVAPHVPEPLFHQVFALLAKDQTGDAAKVAQRLLAHPAPDASALGCMAMGLVKSAQGDRAGAARQFESAVGHSDRYGTYALTFLADALSDLNRGEEARLAYGKALERDPTNLRARMGLGYLHFARRDLDKADAEFARAQAQAARGDARNEAEPLFFRGVVAEEERRLQRAQQFYRKAIERDGDIADYHLGLGALYERLDQKRKAVKCYRLAALKDPGDALASLQAGLLLQELEQGKAALKHLEDAIERDPELLDAYLAAGAVCQDQLSRPRDALRHYEAYLAAGGTDPTVREWIAELRGDKR